MSEVNLPWQEDILRMSRSPVYSEDWWQWLRIPHDERQWWLQHGEKLTLREQATREFTYYTLQAPPEERAAWERREAENRLAKKIAIENDKMARQRMHELFNPCYAPGEQWKYLKSGLIVIGIAIVIVAILIANIPQ